MYVYMYIHMCTCVSICIELRVHIEYMDITKNKHILAHFFFKEFFLMWTIFKVFIEFVTILLYVLFFCPWGMWDLSLPTRDQTLTPCTGRWSLNHWTAREAPRMSLTGLTWRCQQAWFLWRFGDNLVFGFASHEGLWSFLGLGCCITFPCPLLPASTLPFLSYHQISCSLPLRRLEITLSPHGYSRINSLISRSLTSSHLQSSSCHIR